MKGSALIASGRFYELFYQSNSPYINQFLSADTIVPNPTNPQNLNRYSYVINNPLRYTDPTGHFCIEEDGDGNIIHVDCGSGMPPSTQNSPGEESDDESREPDDVFHPFGLDSDYYSLSIYHGFPGWLLASGIGLVGLAEPTPASEIGAVTLALLVNGGLTFTVDRYGRLYISPGVSAGLNSFEPLPTVSLVTGNLVHGRDQGLPIFEQSSPDEISALLTEFSTTHGGCNAFFPCVGTTQSPAAPYDSLEFGAGFPGHLNIVTGSFGFGPFPLVGNP